MRYAATFSTDPGGVTYEFRGLSGLIGAQSATWVQDDFTYYTPDVARPAGALQIVWRGASGEKVVTSFAEEDRIAANQSNQLQAIIDRLAAQVPGVGPVVMIPAPAIPELCAVGVFVANNGVPVPGIQVSARLNAGLLATATAVLDRQVTTATTNEDGLATLQLLPSSQVIHGDGRWSIKIGTSPAKAVRVPDTVTVNFATLLS